LCESFEIAIYHTLHPHRDDPLEKKFMAQKKISILAKGGKVGNSESSQLHMLVDFKYLSLGESFGFEILHICYQLRNDLAKEISS